MCFACPQRRQREEKEQAANARKVGGGARGGGGEGGGGREGGGCHRLNLQRVSRVMRSGFFGTCVGMLVVGKYTLGPCFQGIRRQGDRARCAVVLTLNVPYSSTRAMGPRLPSGDLA